MLNTYIKNRGYTKTIIRNNSSRKKGLNAVNELKWDADYDGDVANINLTSNTNGHKKHFDITLDNNDLENILSIPSVNMPIHERLQTDFLKPRVAIQEPIIYKIELPQPQIETPQLLPIEPKYESQLNELNKLNELEQLLNASKPKNYLSTPLSDEELFFPMSINQKNLRKTRRRGNKQKKTHKTYRVYKRHRTNSHSKSSKRSHRKSRSNDLTFF
jgi:hypothetical protein